MRNFFSSSMAAFRSRDVRGFAIRSSEAMPRWGGKIEKLTIGSLDDVKLTVET